MTNYQAWKINRRHKRAAKQAAKGKGNFGRVDSIVDGTISARVFRTDGTVEDLGVISRPGGNK